MRIFSRSNLLVGGLVSATVVSASYFHYVASETNSDRTGPTTCPTTATAAHVLLHHHHQPPTTPSSFTDFSNVDSVRDWIQQCIDTAHQNGDQQEKGFVKEVDTFSYRHHNHNHNHLHHHNHHHSANHGENPVTVDISSFLESKKVPPTQLQVWRLGSDSSTDFPALSKKQLLEENGFPLHFASDEDEKKHNSSLFASPVLRLVVYLPKASTARALSECTDPSRRKKWDSQYDEFWILQSCRRSNNSNNRTGKIVLPKCDTNQLQEQDPWAVFSRDEEEPSSTSPVVFKDDEQEKQPPQQKESAAENTARAKAQTLLSSREYQDVILKNRFRHSSGTNTEFAFEFDYVRWTFHRIYSKMTAAFGVKPRLSYMERVFGSRTIFVRGDDNKKDEKFVIRCGVDCSLPLPPPPRPPPSHSAVISSSNSAGSEDKTATATTAVTKTTTTTTATTSAVDLALKIAADSAKIPKAADVPVHSHFQELLLFPVPKGASSKRVAELATAAGQDDLRNLVPFYEKEWLPLVLTERSDAAAAAAAKSTAASHDGVLMSFTTVNSTGLLGYPRWFERNVQKIFSSHAMGNLMNAVHEMDEPPTKHGDVA